MTPEQIRDNFNLFVTMVMTDKTVKIVARNKELEARVEKLEAELERAWKAIDTLSSCLNHNDKRFEEYVISHNQEKHEPSDYAKYMRRQREAEMEQRAYRIISEMPSFTFPSGMGNTK